MRLNFLAEINSQISINRPPGIVIEGTIMDFTIKSHRHANSMVQRKEFVEDYNNLLKCLESISDDDIITDFEANGSKDTSISKSINRLIRQRLTHEGWSDESPIFQSDKHGTGMWRLDFVKGKISLEVAFNHGEATAWNLLKPTLASEVNNVQKAVKTELGIIIFVTKAMKKAGGFDGAVGTLEKAETFLTPMYGMLICPLILIGLEPPSTFEVEHTKLGNRKIGRIKRI